ncbi:glycosyltransferase family 1 protein [Rufibacter sp. XAAS-G3-1]|uniref:glycosyltransferase family 4 protein n=1 Tax=Rufibacter sp. XAAS-G3-1 TaxID=2729134 RepID=UPI001C62CD95|nr:glycosyltransferase family 1 protein [Rufibacter sp. XAAS-G3-1]
MPSLVIDARMVHASGIGVYLRQLIPFLAEHFTISLLGKEEELQEAAMGSSGKIIPVNAPIYSLQEQVALFTEIPVCDIFWSPHYNIPLLPVKALKRVVTIHDTYHRAYQHTLPLAQKAYAAVLLNAAVLRSDKVVTVSAFSKKEIKTYTKCPEQKLHVIHNGVNPALFSAYFPENAPETLRSHLPELPKKFILYVGNVKPHKNLITLLKAYAQLPLALKAQYGIVIVGKQEGFITPDQEVFQFLQQEPSLQNRVHFTGLVPDELLPFLYKCASLFVFPSFYEGFGLPPLEAMACGCPVLVSSAASIPEVCGDAALYFNPLDVNELAQQMEKVLNDETLRQALIKKGVRRSSLFSWQESGNRHLALFQELLAPVPMGPF